MGAATAVLTVPDARIAALRDAGRGWFAAGRPTVIAAAPGRLDVMGGIADYSGATVLEGTIGDLAAVAFQRRDDDRLRVRTTGPEAGRLGCTEYSIHIGDLYAVATGSERMRAALKPYAAVRALFPPEARWAAYVLGVLYVLLAEGELDDLPGGADLLLYSTVPLGAGVASSAAIEVAAMRAVVAAYGGRTAGLRLAALCQLVENGVVGAPCGIMDQVTCALGRPGELLALRCQPHEITGWHAPPPGYAFIGLDSGVKHAVGGRRYPVVRCAAFMGRAIIREQLRLSGEPEERGGYLCNLTPAEFRTRFRDLLPARLAGHAFLDRWGETGDPATVIELDQVYPVRGATEHPILENGRVGSFMRHLAAAGSVAQHGGAGGRRRGEGVGGRARGAMIAAGRLMYGSHRSYSRNCGLGSKETDLLVSLVHSEGAAHGLLGAKITGGGSGGTVAVLVEADGAQVPATRVMKALERISTVYEAKVGRRPRLIEGSLPGAESIAPAVLTW